MITRLDKSRDVAAFDPAGTPSESPARLKDYILRKQRGGSEMEEEQAIAVARALGGDV